MAETMNDEKKPLSPGAVVAWSAVVTITLGLFFGTLLIKPPTKR